MTIEITNTNGVVTIKDTTVPLTTDQLNFTAPVNSFHLVIDIATDTVQIRHTASNRVVCAGTLADYDIVAADIDALVAAISALLFDAVAMSSSSALERGHVYVSANGSDSNPGSILRPFATFAYAASVCADIYDETNVLCTIHVLAGEYDERLLGNGIPLGVQQYHIHAGAYIGVTSTGAAVSDTTGAVTIYMEPGSMIKSLGGNVITSTDLPITVYGHGTLRCGTAAAAVVSSAGANGYALIDGPILDNASGIDCAVAVIINGTIILRNCRVNHQAAIIPVQKEGGQMLISNCEIVTASANYADSTGLEEIKVIGSAASAAATANITEVVSSMLIYPTLL